MLAQHDELNPLQAAEARFDLAAEALNLDEGLCKILRTPTREVIVHTREIAVEFGAIENECRCFQFVQVTKGHINLTVCF